MRRIFSSLETRHATLFRQMMIEGKLAPSLTLSKIVCFVIACLVHMITLIFAAAGLILLVASFISLFQGSVSAGVPGLFGSMFSFLIMFALAPRLGRYPKDVASYKDYPELFALVDAVAACLHSRPVDGIEFTVKYNAWFSRPGLRRKTLLSIGVPLWAMLDEKEQLALLAHEIAHGVNGDPTRGLIIGSAIHALWDWNRIAWALCRNRSILALVGIPLVILTSPLLWLLQRLILYEAQRAEYYADSLAATVSGTNAALSLLSKLQFGGQFRTFAGNARTSIAPSTLLARFRAHVESALADEGKLAPLEEEHNTRDNIYSWTHPPLAYRRKFLAAHPVESPLLTLSTEQIAWLQKEFDPVATYFTELVVQGKLKI